MQIIMSNCNYDLTVPTEDQAFWSWKGTTDNSICHRKFSYDI